MPRSRSTEVVLPPAFFERPSLEVAESLLGQVLVREVDGVRLAGRIVEVEAYLGERDLASHASKGRTARTEPMWGPPGRAYVYLIYGMHHCFNVVCEREGLPSAVLVRALEPVEGVDWMQARRGVKRIEDVASGPGKICAALAIDRTFSGAPLDSAALHVAAGEPLAPRRIARSARIGVDYAGAWARRRYRLFERGSRFVSR